MILNKIIILLINLYQKTLSPDHGPLKKIGFFRTPVCVFYPTCSEYAKGVFTRHNFFKALRFTVVRVLRCHPWQKNHWDPIP